VTRARNDASDELRQAAGIVSIQANCTIDEATDLIAARAGHRGQTTRAVLRHIIRFDE
jgi:hypothetical protein